MRGLTSASRGSEPSQQQHGGVLLRQWRQRRRRSQLDLALDTGISARHLSFVETGRSRPSRGLLLALAEQLDVPLRERNALMLAAGYAPTYAESDLDSAETQQARDALERLLAGHEPYPAVVLDRWGDVVLTNRAVGPLLEGVDARAAAAADQHLPAQPAPERDGLADPQHAPNGPPTSDTGWLGWPGSPATRGWRSCSTRYAPTRASPRRSTTTTNRRPSELLLTLQLAHPAGDLRLHSTVTSFGSPHDVTLSELTVESFFPADDATRQRLQELSEPST